MRYVLAVLLALSASVNAAERNPQDAINNLFSGNTAVTQVNSPCVTAMLEKATQQYGTNTAWAMRSQFVMMCEQAQKQHGEQALTK